MNAFVRRILIQYYWLVILAAFIVAGIIIFYSPRTRDDIALAITVVGGVFSFFFVIQKQASEDIRLFRELFVDLNKRYDKMNEKLNRIASEEPTSPLTEKEKDILNDYFNLCGEEYLYFKQGFILPEVWQSWCNGMYFFLENPRIKPMWTNEQGSLSYYGLKTQIIYKETGRRK